MSLFRKGVTAFQGQVFLYRERGVEGWRALHDAVKRHKIELIMMSSDAEVGDP